MLEKYSKNLEEIVHEKTASLREEKQKVESLLERMLPKSVANQLMQGLKVIFILFVVLLSQPTQDVKATLYQRRLICLR